MFSLDYLFFRVNVQLFTVFVKVNKYWWLHSLWNWWWRLAKLTPRPESKGGRLVSRQWSIQDWSNLPMITIVESRDDPHTDDHERLLLQTNLLLTPRVVSVVDHNQTRFIWDPLGGCNLFSFTFRSPPWVDQTAIGTLLFATVQKSRDLNFCQKVLVEPHSLA